MSVKWTEMEVDIARTNCIFCCSGSSICDIAAPLTARTSVFHPCCEHCGGRGADLVGMATKYWGHFTTIDLPALVSLLYLHCDRSTSGTCRV